MAGGRRLAVGAGWMTRGEEWQAHYVMDAHGMRRQTPKGGLECRCRYGCCACPLRERTRQRWPVRAKVAKR